MQTFDRAAEDLGNSIHIEHVNVQIPDQRIGDAVLRRGPRAHARSLPMVVRQQHVDQCRPQPVPSADRPAAGAARPHRHRDPRPRGAARAPHRGAQEARRHALRFPRAQRLRRGDLPVGQSLPLLRARRRALRPHRARLSLCRVRRAGRHARTASRHSIARWSTRRPRWSNGDGTVARVTDRQGPAPVQFRETDRPQPEFDGHHIADLRDEFLRPAPPAERAQARQPGGQPVPVPLPRHRRSRQRRPLFTIEHEVRSVSHPMFLRPLVNRNPTQTNRNYAAGYQELPLAMEPELYDPPVAN